MLYQLLYTNFDWYRHHFHVLNLRCQDPVPKAPEFLIIKKKTTTTKEKKKESIILKKLLGKTSTSVA